jgi:hypothetical protein
MSLIIEKPTIIEAGRLRSHVNVQLTILEDAEAETTERRMKIFREVTILTPLMNFPTIRQATTSATSVGESISHGSQNSSSYLP